MTSFPVTERRGTALRTYDDFTFAETHNAFSTPEDGIMGGINHLTGLQSQWEDGIRAFMVDSHHQSNTNSEKEDVVFCLPQSWPFFHPMQLWRVLMHSNG